MPGAIRVPRPLAPAPEIWGGFECSVTRVRDEWRDQVRETGHHDRLEDLNASRQSGSGRFAILFSGSESAVTSATTELGHGTIARWGNSELSAWMS